MYPKSCYISYGVPNNTFQEYREVIITGYTDAISVGAFANLNLNVAFDLATKGVGNYSPYSYSYSVKWQGMWATDQKIQEVVSKRSGVDCVDKIVGDPIKLMDYYKEIGYNHKRKHFEGKTLRRFILDKIGE